MSGIKEILESYPEISFIEDKTLQSVQEEMLSDFISKYEELEGKTLTMGEADPNRLILYAASLQLYQLYIYLDNAGKQGLLKYSYGDNLENMAALKQLKRKSGSYATTTIRFTLSEKQNSVITIPMGTRITAGDNIYFYTKETIEIQPGETKGEVIAVCDTIGESGNGYEAGMLNRLVSPIAFVNEVKNMSISQGGAEEESDESLAERIYLSPSSYSVAGPKDAYKYWVKAYSTSISDVFVESPAPSCIDIRFILEDGQLPEEAIIKEVLEFVSDKTKRPQTDLVTVAAPDIVEYNIDLTYYIETNDSKSAATIKTEVETAIEVYKRWQQEKIGRDINPSVLITKIVQAGAKRAEIRSPTFNVLENTQIARVNNCNIIYGGLEDD